MDNEDENGGHGYVEHASIGGAIVHVFYADDKEGCEADEKVKDQTISELTKKLSDQKNANDADMAQAVKDAQDTRAKSDQIVNQYVGK